VCTHTVWLHQKTLSLYGGSYAAFLQVTARLDTWRRVDGLEGAAAMGVGRTTLGGGSVGVCWRLAILSDRVCSCRPLAVYG
jgi:hypothetical protein